MPIIANDSKRLIMVISYNFAGGIRLDPDEIEDLIDDGFIELENVALNKDIYASSILNEYEIEIYTEWGI